MYLCSVLKITTKFYNLKTNYMMYNDFNIGKYDAKIAPIKYGRTSFYSLDRYDVFRGQFPVNVLLNDLTIIKPKK